MAFQGSLKELPLPDIIQLVAVSGKTGVFQLKSRGESGQIFIRSGQIIHAETGDITGEEAVYELAIWPEGEFVFTPGAETANATIEKSNTNLLMEAARRIDEWQVLSKRIPSTRLVPVYADQDGTTSVSLTPQEWAVVRKIDERRTIEEIAAGLGMSPFEISKILYGLITSGLVALKEDLHRFNLERLHKMTEPELRELSESIVRAGRELLAGHPRATDLEAVQRQGRAEMEAGRGVDAVLDLVRAEEKLVSAALGPHQAKAFLDRVVGLIRERP